jgi:hypothetical protein
MGSSVVTLAGNSTVASAAGTPAVIIPNGWGVNWKAKLTAAQAGAGLASVAFVGDSVSAGQFCSNLDTTNLAGLVRLSLQGTYGDGGSGYKSLYDCAQLLGNPYSSGGAPSVAAGSLVALTGTWNQSTSNADGPGAQHLEAQTNGATATYVVHGTTVKTYVLQSTGATFGHYTVTIDGNVSATFNTGSQGANGCQVQTFSGLAAGAHTVVITCGIGETLSGSLQVFVNGVQGLNAAGVIVNKYARGSYPSGAFNNVVGSAQFYTSAGVQVGGTSTGTFAPSGKWSGGSLNPSDLIIYSMGLNDCRPSGQATSPDAYVKNIYLYLSDVREANPLTDIVLMLQHGGDPSWAEASKYYAAYGERLQSLAATFNAVFIDFWKLGNNSWAGMKTAGYMADAANNAGISGSNQVHLSDAGFAWQAATLLPVLRVL